MSTKTQHFVNMIFHHLTNDVLYFRLYSCLANGSADEFQKGEHLFKARAVKDALQIGKLVILNFKFYFKYSNIKLMKYSDLDK